MCISFYKALSTVRLLNAALYECVDIEIAICFFAFVEIREAEFVIIFTISHLALPSVLWPMKHVLHLKSAINK